METLKFKTSIKCSGCIDKITPFLDKVVGHENWQVNIQHPDKILTVSSPKTVTEEKIITALKEAGYKAEKLA